VNQSSAHTLTKPPPASAYNLTNPSEILIKMDRLQSLEMTALECAALLGAKTHTYRPKQNYLNAIRYDGSLQMAIAIEECCSHSYIDWDEGENFCGLRAFTEWGIDNSKSQSVNEGDYLVRVGKRYVLFCQEDFEKEYELVL